MMGDLKHNVLSITMIFSVGIVSLCYFSSCDTVESIYPNGRNTFIKVYGYGRLDVAADMIRDRVSGGFVIAGTTFVGSLENIKDWESASDNDALVIFVDENGNGARYAVRPSSGNDLVHQIIQTSDDNFLIVGETRFGSETSVFLWKFDNMGMEVEPFSNASFNDLGSGLGVMEYLDVGGDRIIVTGETTFQSGKTKQLLLLLDSAANALDTLGFGTGIRNNGYRIKQGRYENSSTPEVSGFYNIRNQKDSVTLEFEYLIEFRDLVESSDGQINGAIGSNKGTSNDDPKQGLCVDFLFKDNNLYNPDIFALSNSENSDGDKVVVFTKWVQNNGKYDNVNNNPTLNFIIDGINEPADNVEGRNVIRLRNNKFLLNGTDIDRRKILISNFETDGTVNWTKIYGSDGEYGLGGSIVELEDGSLVFCGTVDFENANLKIALYKTDSEGNLDF